ncbi:Tectonic-3 [Tupaia chinensis]|uniref:Tectonic-3 n=1 Tax=Tupaia chinensis TaxID=246437 RepID=L9JJF6_TUPCH|nr:Tectonic-3 [Tupaia chinensis]
MCAPPFVLLPVFLWTLPEGAGSQASSTPTGAMPTSPDLGPGTPGGTLRPSEGTATPRAVPGPSAGGPTLAAPENGTADLFPALPICVCDLTPGACDINCCCDRDCGLLHPRTVFSFCLPGSVRSSSWVCVDSSLIFRSNSPFPSRVFTDSDGVPQFCVRVNDSKLNHFQKLQTVNATNFQALAAEFEGEPFTSVSRAQSLLPFYRAGDPILTYFPEWSVTSLLRQPMGVGAGGFCAETNPAGFLESKSTSCTRFFKNLASSCTSDPALSAASYSNFTVLKVPEGMTDLQDTKVIYEIETNGTFGIQKVSVSFGQTNLTIEPDASFQQRFTVRFRMTLLQSLGNGICSPERREVLFGVNAVSGCKLRLKKANCSHLQQEIYQHLHGRPRPEHVAIFGNAAPAQKGGWTRILSRSCSVSAVNCTSCCVIPVALEVQVLWAYIGLQSNPQAHVSGARFLYQCQPLQDSQQEPEISLTTLVNFVDITQKPEPPRGQPRMDWKLPFDFFFPFKVAFSRGVTAQKGSALPTLVLCLLLLARSA